MMTQQRKQRLNEVVLWGACVGSLLTLLAVPWGVWQGGRISQRITTALNESVTKEDMKDWVAETRHLSTNWFPANFTAIFRENREKSGRDL